MKHTHLKASVFIATSADGYIADEHGEVDWLTSAGKQDADMSDNPDMGFNAFIQTVDCMIMGRKCMDVIAAMNLTEEQWPYGSIPIVVLSRTLKRPPSHLPKQVEIYAGDIMSLIQDLERRGFRHAYIDGGMTITQCLNLKLIQHMTISQAPVLLGSGIRLFGELTHDIQLRKVKAETFNNDFVQVKYEVAYAE